MSDTPADVDPDRVVTEGELAAVIVVAVLIFILLVIQIALLIYIFCRKKRCPCTRKKPEADPKPYYENRYGEISWSYAEKKIHRDPKRSDEESLISTDSGSRVIEIEDEHKKKALSPLKREDLDEKKTVDELAPDDERKEGDEAKDDDEEKKDDGEGKKEGDEAQKDDDEAEKEGDEAKKDDEYKKEGDEAKKESDEATKESEETKKDDDEAKREDDDVKKEGDEGKEDDDEGKEEGDEAKKESDETKKDDDDSKKDDDEAKKEGDEGKKDDDEGKEEGDEGKKEGDARLPVDGDEDEHTKKPPLALKQEDDKQKKEAVKDMEEDDLDPDGERKTYIAPPPGVDGGKLEEPRIIGRRKDPDLRDLSEDTELQGQGKTGTDPFNNDKDKLKDGDTPVGQFEVDEEEQEDTSTSRSSVTSSSTTSLQSHVHVTLPGQQGGEDIPVTMESGLRRGMFRPPISEYTKGLPAGLPRFSLPPKGIIDAWKDPPPEVKKDSNPFDKLWTLEDLQEDEDLGYSDPMKSKGHDQNGSDSTGSFETEEGSGTDVAKEVEFNGSPGVYPITGVSGPTRLVEGTGGRPDKGSLGGTDGSPNRGQHGGPDRGTNGLTGGRIGRGPNEGSDRGPQGGTGRGPHGGPDRGPHGGALGGSDRGPHGGTLGGPHGRTDGEPDRGSYGGRHGRPDRGTNGLTGGRSGRGPHGGSDRGPQGGIDGRPDRGPHGGNLGGPHGRTDGEPDRGSYGGRDGRPDRGTNGLTGGRSGRGPQGGIDGVPDRGRTGARPGHEDDKDPKSKGDRKKNTKFANTKDPTSKDPASKGKCKGVSDRWPDDKYKHEPGSIPLGNVSNENDPQSKNGFSITKPTDSDKAKGTSKRDEDKQGLGLPGNQRQRGNEGDSGFGRGESSTDGSLEGKRVEGGYVIDDDDNISCVSEDGPYYWPDRKGRYRGMDQWYDTDDSAAVDINIEDLEFDDRNQVIKPGGFGLNSPPSSTTLLRHPNTKTAFGETPKGAPSRTRQGNNRGPHANIERNPEMGTLSEVAKGDLDTKRKTKDGLPRTQNELDKRRRPLRGSDANNRGKAQKGLDIGHQGKAPTGSDADNWGKAQKGSDIGHQGKAPIGSDADNRGKAQKGLGIGHQGKAPTGSDADNWGKAQKGSDIGNQGKAPIGSDVDNRGKAQKGLGIGHQGKAPTGSDADNRGKAKKGSDMGNQGKAPTGSDADNRGKAKKGSDMGNQGKAPKGSNIGNRGKVPKGSDIGKKVTSNGEISRADGDLSCEHESSDSCYGYRVLGRPPIKEDNNTRTRQGLNITATLGTDKLKMKGVRLGRGLPEDAVIEDNEESSDEEVEYFKSGSLRVKRYRKTGRIRMGDGKGRAQNKDKGSVKTGTRGIRIIRGSDQDEDVSADDVPDGQTGRKTRRRRRRRRQKKDKPVRGPKVDYKWDAYLQYYGDDMYSLLKMIFMESDDDYR